MPANSSMPVAERKSMGISAPTANRQLAKATGTLRMPILSVIGPAATAAIRETTSVMTAMVAISSAALTLAPGSPANT